MVGKLLLRLGTVAVLDGGCAKPAPQQDVAADRPKLRADANSWFDLVAKGDSEGVANLYAEDAVVMPPAVPALTGRPAIKSFIASQIAGLNASHMTANPGTGAGSDASGDMGGGSGTYNIQESSDTAVD